MKPIMFISLLALGLPPLPAQAQQTKLEESELAKVVMAANEAEVAWYKAPKSEAARNKFHEFVAPGSPKDLDVSGVISRALTAASTLVKAEHEVKLVKVDNVPQTAGARAIVTTRETSHWLWTSGRGFEQKDNPHTYRLQCEPLTTKQCIWMVTSDNFNY